MKCPRRGYVILGDGVREFVVPTTCKTWSCRVCSKKVAALVAMKVQYGCRSTGGPSYFITTTYVNNQDGDIRLASVANREWAELWRLLKLDPLWKTAAWWKVPELTKRQQVHFHAIVTGVEGKPSCRKPRESVIRWKQRQCSTDCLEHSLSRAWEAATADSFVVDASAIRSVNGVSWYVQKYMQKTFLSRVGLQALGFKRRYSRSQNWPSLESIHLAGPKGEGWDRVTIVNQKSLLDFHETKRFELRRRAEEDANHPSLAKMGGDYALALALKAEEKRITTIVQRVGGNVDNDH